MNTLIVGSRPTFRLATPAKIDGDNSKTRMSVYAKTKLIGEQAVADAYPEAIVARVNLFGWSLTGKRSLAEFFLAGSAEGILSNPSALATA